MELKRLVKNWEVNLEELKTIVKGMVEQNQRKEARRKNKFAFMLEVASA
jgi:hypothetical protein